MGTISILLRKPPYGTVDASEAIRHALGGITEEMTVHLILLDGGVNAARKNQHLIASEYTNIEDGIRDCMDMGVGVYVDRTSMKNEHAEPDELIKGVIIMGSSDVGELVKNSDTTMIF